MADDPSFKDGLIIRRSSILIPILKEDFLKGPLNLALILLRGMAQGLSYLLEDLDSLLFVLSVLFCPPLTGFTGEMSLPKRPSTFPLGASLFVLPILL